MYIFSLAILHELLYSIRQLRKQQRTEQSREDLQTRQWLEILPVQGAGREVAELQ